MRLCGRGQKSPAGDETKTQIEFGGYDGQQYEFELDRVRRQHTSHEREKPYSMDRQEPRTTCQPGHRRQPPDNEVHRRYPAGSRSGERTRDGADTVPKKSEE